MSAGGLSPARGRWHRCAHVSVSFLVQCRIPARFRMEAACTTAGWTAPGLTVSAESASFWQKTEKPVKVHHNTTHPMALNMANRPFGLSIFFFCVFFVADIDECQTEASNCAHGCHNTLGSYVCVCNAAYELGSDGKQCYSEIYVQKSLLSHLFFTGSRCLVYQRHRVSFF